MNERIKELRKSLGLTQEKFANEIGIKRNTLANYEVGRNEPIDGIIFSICREFGVNEDWLREGTGEMYIKRSNPIVAKASKLLGQKDPVFEAFVKTYSELSPSDREVLLKTGLTFFKNLQDKSDV